MSDLSMHSHHAHGKKNALGKEWAGAGLFGIAILTLIFIMLQFFFKPDWVLRQKDCEYTDEVDCMKAILYSVVFAVITAVVLGLLAYAFSC